MKSNKQAGLISNGAFIVAISYSFSLKSSATHKYLEIKQTYQWEYWINNKWSKKEDKWM